MEEYEVPAGWVHCQLGDVTLPVDKVDQKANPKREIAYIDISGIDNKTNQIVDTKVYKLAEAPSRARQIVKTGDTVFSTVRPYLRNIALVPEKLDGEIASTGFSVLRAANGIDPSFLFFKATSQVFVDALTRVQYGASYPAVNDAQVRSQPLLLPPLPEQQRIVDKIETLFAELDKGEEALRAVQKLLARYRQSVLKAAVTGTLTADWRAANPPTETGQGLLARVLRERRENWQGRGRYEEPIEPNTDGLPELPNGWTWTSLDQLLQTGLANGRSVPDAEIGFPVLRLTALKAGAIDLKEHKVGAWDAQAASNFLVHQHDVLVSRGNGSKRLVGLGGIVSEPAGGVAYPDTMIRIALLLEFVSATWFVKIWNGPFMRSQIEKSAKTTAGIYKINQGDIRSFVVPLPPLAEQVVMDTLVDEKVAQMSVAAGWCATELKRSAALRQSILKDAFSGRLVPQDPSDEPADKLLERIRGRASAPASGKRRRAAA